MSRDPFENFDKHFDNAFNHPVRTGAKFAAVAAFAYALVFLFVVAVIVGAVLFLKAHGVF